MMEETNGADLEFVAAEMRESSAVINIRRKPGENDSEPVRERREGDQDR